MKNCFSNPIIRFKFGKSQFVEVIPFNDNLMISLKGLKICFNIQTRLHGILSIRSFHTESVVVMERK